MFNKLRMIPMVAVVVMAGCASPSQNAGTALAGLGTAAGQQIPTAGTSSAAAAAGAAGGLSGGISAAGQTSGLVDLLVGQLGVSPGQALGGAGSIFSLAQKNLSPADFATLSQSVPGMDQYLGAAPSGLNSGGAMGATAGSVLGGQGSALGNLASLAGSFQSLGLSSDMAGKFLPVVLQYVRGQGGSAAMGLLQKAVAP